MEKNQYILPWGLELKNPHLSTPTVEIKPTLGLSMDCGYFNHSTLHSTLKSFT